MAQPSGRDRLLAGVSAAQLATGLVGMVVGVRRRHPYDVFWMHGSADAIGRDVLTKGTALSAPVSMLITQAALTAMVARRPTRRVAQALGGLGATLVAGYLGERQVRRRLRPSGWDAVESPLLVAAIGLAASMAALGRPGGRGTATARMRSPTTRLAELLGDVRAATAFRYDAHDSLGNRMDTAKVIEHLGGAVVLDAFSRRIVGWSMADHLRTELVLDRAGHGDRPAGARPRAGASP
jgi:transposase InsO family protein